MKKILVTVRDVGAAHQIVMMVRYLRSDPGFDVVLFASEPAGQALNIHGEDYTLFEPILPYQAAITDPNLAALKAGARRLVESERPDMVLCGLSNYAHGIDDAVMQAAGSASWICPSVLLLDDKGPLQSMDGAQPDSILATSEAIALWSESNCQGNVYRIGSPKHDALSRLPVDQIRRGERVRRGLSDSGDLLVFIAQSSDIPGHDQNYADFIETLSEAADGGWRHDLILRGHPGFPETANAYLVRARNAGLNTTLDSGGDITPLLCAADMVVTCTSTVIQDYTWLARGGEDLRARLVHMLIGDDIRSWLEETFGDWRPAAVRQGLARAIISHQELTDLFRNELFLDKLGAGVPAANIVPTATPEIDDPRTASLTAVSAILAGAAPGSQRSSTAAGRT